MIYIGYVNLFYNIYFLSDKHLNMYSVHVTFSCHKTVIYFVNLFSPFVMLCGSTDTLFSETCYYILVCKVLINGKK